MIVAEPTDRKTLPAAEPLRCGDVLRCPRCEQTRPAWAYRRLLRPKSYAAVTTDVYVCPACRFTFALREDV